MDQSRFEQLLDGSVASPLVGAWAPLRVRNGRRSERKATASPRIERLEPRQLLASDTSAFANIDVSHLAGNESEAAVAIDRTNPDRVFIASNIDDSVPDLPSKPGLFVATSDDAGATWTGRIIGRDENDPLPKACCDPTAAFDSFGNLFLGYVNDDGRRVEVLKSSDGGRSFAPLMTFRGHVDQPTLTTGPGSVWITFTKGNDVVAAGAAVSGPGAVAAFGQLQKVPRTDGFTFGDIAVSADGQVAVTFQGGRAGNSAIGVSVDPDGLGPAGFGRRVIATRTRVGLFDLIPPQDFRGIDAEAGLAFDRSTGPHRGRLYLVYTDAAPRSKVNTDVFLRYSDDGGSTWGNAVRVNDDLGLAQQFLPRVATDDTTGEVAVSWYDTRDDPGAAATQTSPSLTGAAPQQPTLGDSKAAVSIPRGRTKTAERQDHARREAGEGRGRGEGHGGRGGGGLSPGRPTVDVANDDAAFYAARAVPTDSGVLVSANARISAGAASAVAAENGIDLGDYTALDFHNGVLYPAWSDNSNTAGNNPDGTFQDLDIYAARVPAAALPDPARAAAGGTGGGGGPGVSFVNAGFAAVASGAGTALTLRYNSPQGVDVSELNGAELSVAGPGGFLEPGRIVKMKTNRDMTVVTIKYAVNNPSGRWQHEDDGVYTVSLVDGRLKDLLGTAAPGGELANFVVDVA